MTAENFKSGRAFMTPAFRITLAGQEPPREVLADILEVSFSDDLNAVDSFEFVLNDWDPVALQPKYSSPWNADGTPIKLSSGGPDAPNYEPGAKVSLYLGYNEDGDLPLIMEGEVVSISPSFPASGAPTCRVRAVNSFLRSLQKVRVEANYSGTPKNIVDAMCRDNGVTVRWAPIEAEGKDEEKVEVEGILFEEIESRASAYGLSIMTEQSESGPVLVLARPADDTSDPVAAFEWGRTLISFTPALSAATQVSEVIVRGGDPTKADAEAEIEVSRTWADIGLSPSAIGPTGRADLGTAVSGIAEVIKPDDVATQEDAERAALARLRELAADLITGSGSALGLPSLRAGKTVTMVGIGARFDGTYRLTQTTHTLGGAGYTTSFQARKEVLDG